MEQFMLTIDFTQFTPNQLAAALDMPLVAGMALAHHLITCIYTSRTACSDASHATHMSENHQKKISVDGMRGDDRDAVCGDDRGDNPPPRNSLD
jgi:hypothetical protein